MVVRQNPSSTKRYLIDEYDGFIVILKTCKLITLGKDNEEGRFTVRMHAVQIQNAAAFEAMQAVRSYLNCMSDYQLTT